MLKLHLAALIALTVLSAGCGSEERNTSVAASKTAADNTARNVSDRNDAKPTPLDQGENEADRAITQMIRKAVMENGATSVNGQNVKIITQNGVVTLRGPVDSEAEKMFIGTTARGVAGVVKVDDQLEIAVKPH
ncbi:MAG: BON domain-containing protein [bacterium]